MSNKKQKIGWIGVGRMGYQMAERLAKADYDISIWNRTKSKAEPLAKVGAKVVDKLSDLSGVDILFAIVSETGVAAGTRRIEAITGIESLKAFQADRDLVASRQRAREGEARKVGARDRQEHSHHAQEHPERGAVPGAESRKA